MWKLSCIVFTLITIGNSSTQDQPGTTETSRNFRNYENQFQRYRSEVRSIEYVGAEVDRRDVEDYPRGDSDEFPDEALIGRWRNSGSALEPKWRDGDSLPLVPFDDSSRRKKVNSHDAKNEETRVFVSSRHTEKLFDPGDPTLSRVQVEDELTMTKIPIANKDRGESYDDEINERYGRLKENPEIGNSRTDDPSDDRILQAEKIPRIPGARSSNIAFKETAVATRSSELPMRRTEKTRNAEESKYAIGSDILSKMRYDDAFQTHPNEYELNDEEYQKPRPRKRRPPQTYEFVETRPPTYSISWSTERYVETTSSNHDESSTGRTSAKKSEVSTRRSGITEKKSSPRERPSSRRKSDNAELRSLLKMQEIEGLSLSELLQRRNFTLNDLLRGKAEVLNVLKSGADENSDEVIGERSKIFEAKRLNGSSHEERDWKWQSSTDQLSTSRDKVTIARTETGTSSSTTVENEETDEEMDSAESSDRTDESGSSSENEKLSTIVRLMKPIILPSQNILSNKTIPREFSKDSLENQNRKDDKIRVNESSSTLDDDEIMEFSDFTVGKAEATTEGRRLEETTKKRYESLFNEDSGSTLSIENILSSTQRTSTFLNNRTRIYPSNVKSGAIDPARYPFSDLDYQSDEPHLTVNDDSASEKVSAVSGEEITTRKIDEIPVNNANGISPKYEEASRGDPYEVIVSDIEPEARAEIFELFSTGSSAKRLERLLKSRNMSIDELIELRQRGSSRVHLAEKLRSHGDAHSRDNQRTEVGEELKTTTLSKERRIPITGIPSGIASDTQESRPTEETDVSFLSADKTKLNFSTVDESSDESQESLDFLGSFDSLPYFSRRPVFNPASRNFTNQAETGTQSTLAMDENIVQVTPKNSEHPTHRVIIGLVEEITDGSIDSVDNDVTEIKTARTNHSTIGRKKGEKSHLSKVRPSIIASGAILGFTVVVFCAIFVVCRIRQKQRYTYRNNFARSVFQAPATTARKLSNSSSLNTIMVNVVATSTNKRPERRNDDHREVEENFESRSDIENDSLDDTNDSWETIPDFMK